MKNRLVVTATGEVSHPSDQASLVLGASVVRPDPGTAIGEVGGKVEALIETLGGLGVGRQSIRTSDLSLWPETNAHGTPAGYRARNALHIDLDDLAAVGTILRAALAAIGEGAEMNGITFSLKDPDAASVQARAKAFRAARAKAEQLAALSGRGLGPVLGIEEVAGMPPHPMPVAKLAMAETMPIEVGSTPVTVTLQVHFALVG